MKYKYNNEWKEMNVKVSDTLPIGSVVDYDGEVVPSGWEEVNGLIESGTWTPVLACVGSEQAPTYTISIVRGKYRRIEDLVYIEFYIRGVITALNGTNNYAIVKGLPYNTSAQYQGQQALGKGIVYELLDNPINIVLNPYNDGIRIQNTDGSAAAAYKVTTAPYFEIGGSGWYIAES